MACDNTNALTSADIVLVTDNIKAVNEWAGGDENTVTEMPSGQMIPSLAKVITDANIPIDFVTDARNSATSAANSANEVANTVIDNSVIPAINFEALGITNVVDVSMCRNSNGTDWTDKTAGASWEKEVPVEGVYEGSVTTTERDALTPLEGMLCYNSTVSQWQKYIANPALYIGEHASDSIGWNVTTRGNQRKFPVHACVAVRVNSIYILDLTQAEPVIFKILSGTGLANITSVSMLDSTLVITKSDGTANTYQGTWVLDFASETSAHYLSSASSNNGYNKDFSDLSIPVEVRTDSFLITDNSCRKVSLSVLSNAPNNPATNMPYVTIFIGNDGACDVINGTAGIGTVVSFADGAIGTRRYHESLVDNVGRVLSRNHSNGSIKVLDSIPTSDRTTVDHTYGNAIANVALGQYPIVINGANDNKIILGSNSKVAVAGINGYQLLKENPSDPSKGMVARITTKSNSGFLHGAIKGCYVPDADVTSLVGSELAPNLAGYADESAAIADGWSFTGSGAFDAGNDEIDHTSGTAEVFAAYAGAVVAGEVYIITYTLANYTGSGSFRVRLGGAYSSSVSSDGVYTDTIVANGTTLDLQAVNSTCGGSFKLFSIRKAIPDRSVNNNAIGVHGTLSYNAVTTGSEQKALSGFNTGNFGSQPYNSDFDYGTGALFWLAWVKPTTSDQNFWDRGNGTDSTNRLQIQNSSSNKFRVNLAGTVLFTSQSLTLAGFQLVGFVRENGVGYLYINGKLDSSGAMAGSVSGAFVSKLGVSQNESDPLDAGGAICVPRQGSGAMSADQMLATYNTEEEWFKEGAKNLLQGANDACLDVAYDESEDTYSVVQADYVNRIKGLTVVDSYASNAGALTSVASENGTVIQGGATSYIKIPKMEMREELMKSQAQHAGQEKRLDTLESTANRQIQMEVINLTGSTIDIGEAVRHNGVLDGDVRIVLAQADSFNNATILGITAQSIPDGEKGLLVTFGEITGMDTSALAVGVPIYLSDTVAGGFTATSPVIRTQLGGVIEQGTSGKFFVTIENNIALPRMLGSLLGATAPTSVPLDLVNGTAITAYASDIEIVTQVNTTTGVITIPLDGTYRLNVSMHMQFDNVGGAGKKELYLDLVDITTSTTVKSLKGFILKDAETYSMTDNCTVDLTEAHEYRLEIRSEVALVGFSFSSSTFYIESILY